MLSIEDMPTAQDVYVTNETRETWTGSLRWTLETLDGQTLDSGEAPVSASPFDVARICQLQFASRLTDDLRRETVFVADLLQNGQLVSQRTAFFVPTKHLSLANPSIVANLRAEQGQLVIELTARSLARLVEVSLEGADVVFSDNYFDLPANRPTTVTAPLPADWTLAQAQAAFKVRSVYDSFARE